MSKYKKVRVKLTTIQLIQLKSAVKYQLKATLRITKKKSRSKGSPHELILTTRRKAKTRTAFNNNQSTAKRPSKTQIFKSGGFIGALLSKLAGLVMRMAILLAKNIFFP